ncbi:molybdopterin-dependent oxidoreductase [Thiorhodococcus mannitoliphagus]|uniref:Molybdopterin-dependent oxidoreductase n=1 Tax=Thiorhodococcus mannitoliphagus TaxID=329406 RepID=A0A6P1DZB1_9GAMM|nr:molybdopterin-dependent oxidoreductase [Thiorhodococcus mannitoliphagus]NEX22361.1 molybdopterin-dependent oxidoreductase [Thiorhodococcus mannitoliphagus]
MNAAMAPNAQGVGTPGRRTVYSLCGMCAVRCPMEVTVEDGRATWLQGNPHDVAIGASLCAKGAAGLALEADDERPQTPLIRLGERGEGRWRRASWDEALDYIAEKLQETMAEHGSRGIALSDRGGPFVDLTRTFVTALGSPNYFNHDATCGGNVHNAARATYGFSHAGLIPDLMRTKHLVLYGRNIIESLMVKEAKGFMAAVSRGMRVTYIDPRASKTACKASRYWQVRPNSDYALNLALIHEILKRECYDKAFVDRFVLGMDVLRKAVKDSTPEWQAPHTGIPAAELRAFVDEIAGQMPHVLFNPGWMTARHKQSFQVSRTALILNALMGNLECPGGYIIAKPPEYYGRKSLQALTTRVPKVTEPRVDGAGTTRPTWDPSIGMLHQLFAAMETGQPYGIGAYIAYRHDPLTAMPDTEALKRALDKLNLLVSIDVRYCETGWYADVILPESTYLERANILTQLPGPVPVMLMRDQAVAPRFDSRPAWWIFREILRRMGQKEALDFETIEELWNWQLEGTGVTVAELRETGIVPLAEVPRITPRDKLRFPTPSGKIEIDSSLLAAAGLPVLPPYEPREAPTGDAFTLLFGRPPTLAHGQSLNNPLLNEIAPEQQVWLHPERAAALGVRDGDMVEISGGAYSGRLKAHVTPWIHPEAAFLLHGYGATVPVATRALGRGIADQRLQHGKLYEFDPAGGGNALTETIVRIRPAPEHEQEVAR